MQYKLVSHFSKSNNAVVFDRNLRICFSPPLVSVFLLLNFHANVKAQDAKIDYCNKDNRQHL